MNATDIHAGRRYMNSFGVTYVVHAIDDGVAVYTIDGLKRSGEIRMRMVIDNFARHMVHELPEPTE